MPKGEREERKYTGTIALYWLLCLIVVSELLPLLSLQWTGGCILGLSL